MRTWATSITVRRVESAVRYMTTEQIDHTIDAIEAGADVRRGPDDTPAQFRRALEKAREARAEGRYHPDYSPNPRNFAEQLGGVPAGISRRFVAPEEEVPAP